MARKQIIQLESDLSGKEADETVNFKLDNAGYEIDLTTGEAEKFRTELEPYVQSARRTTRTYKRKTTA